MEKYVTDELEEVYGKHYKRNGLLLELALGVSALAASSAVLYKVATDMEIRHERYEVKDRIESEYESYGALTSSDKISDYDSLYDTLDTIKIGTAGALAVATAFKICSDSKKLVKEVKKEKNR